MPRRPSKPKNRSMIEHMRLNSDYPNTGCWELHGRRDKDGYCKVSEDGKTYQAHRYGFIKLKWSGLTSDLVVMHKCDNPPCWNPEHMQLGTHRQNIADKFAKGRQYEPVPVELVYVTSPPCQCGRCICGDADAVALLSDAVRLN